jgi:peptide/nickel transport system permease protein
MGAYLARRLGGALLVLVVVSTLTFALVHLAPGGPAVLADPKLSREEVAAIERRLGLDRPLAEQYARWMAGVARGDLGSSFLYQTPVRATIAERLPNTAILAGLALLVSAIVAVPLALRAAERPGGAVDRAADALSFLAISTPAFWLGIVAVLCFAVWLRVLPAGGAATPGLEHSLVDRARHAVLPVLVLAAGIGAEMLRYTRAAAARSFGRDFVRTARAKGVSDAAIRGRHVMRHVLVAVATLVGLQLPRLLGGAAITETVFSWPGMGRLGVEAALARDYPLVMGITLTVAVAVVTTSLVVDVLYLVIDPRARLGRD